MNANSNADSGVVDAGVDAPTVEEERQWDIGQQERGQQEG
jgi:hypothetical protein